jgi:hypothetical protein
MTDKCRVNVPLEILNLHDDGFHLLVEVVVFNKAFKAVVDTGASRTVLDKTTVEEYIDKETLLLSDKLSTGLGTNTMESYILTIPHFEIGNLNIPGFETAVLDLSSINQAYGQVYDEPIIGVVGGDILMRYGAVIDYKKSELGFALEN